jgi:hypothetical protein
VRRRKCGDCGKIKRIEVGRDVCFHCRVSGVSFAFVGGGGKTRQMFHDYTVKERRAEILGDKVVGRDVLPTSEYGW